MPEIYDIFGIYNDHAKLTVISAKKMVAKHAILKNVWGNFILVFHILRSSGRMYLSLNGAFPITVFSSVECGPPFHPRKSCFSSVRKIGDRFKIDTILRNSHSCTLKKARFNIFFGSESGVIPGSTWSNFQLAPSHWSIVLAKNI